MSYKPLINLRAIFGFGATANDDNGSVPKLSSLDDKSILSDTPIHNLAEERNVGRLNFELNFRGRNQFKTSSQNLVLNKSTDLIRSNFEHLGKFKVQAKQIKELKQQWSRKMEEIEKEGMSLKDTASLT